jgi:hypothetical protein
MCLAGSALALAQGAPAGDGPPVLARTLAPSRGGSANLLVTSGAFRSGTSLDDKFTQNGDNMSPPITWSKGPPGTQSYAVLAEDAGVNRKDPIVHWIIYNIPSTSTNLSQGLPSDATLENGAMQGKNVRGAAGYIGPKPPAGQVHPYHFQVFALRSRLNIDPATADRATVLAAMKSRVLASGDLVANYTGK